MSLEGSVQSAITGLLGFDSNTVITAAAAQNFFAQGYRFCLRYLSRGPESPSDLSAPEAEVILQSGLALMAVQHVRKAGWQPTGALGQQDGQDAAQNASDVGFPSGVSIWCDLEGVLSGTVAQDVIDYCDSWFTEVANAGYVPGLYVGSSCVLNEQQLFNLKFQHYWRSQSNVPNVGSRGYQMIQLFPEVPVNGIKVDIDVTQSDFKQGQVKWLVRPAAAAATNIGG
ncbi:MAG TPA: DUF1906 domain-containing protein [Candidatus Angelobacter sp.]|nr:DUF1906 domain-containing protein [Candidatus Angelobacter sp.]